MKPPHPWTNAWEHFQRTPPGKKTANVLKPRLRPRTDLSLTKYWRWCPKTETAPSQGSWTHCYLCLYLHQLFSWKNCAAGHSKVEFVFWGHNQASLKWGLWTSSSQLPYDPTPQHDAHQVLLFLLQEYCEVCGFLVVYTPKEKKDKKAFSKFDGICKCLLNFKYAKIYYRLRPLLKSL